jgi:hypothetical protein
MDLNTEDCTRCHEENTKAPTFREIHSGYDKAIYTAEGQKYSEVISVTIESAVLTDNMLDITFSAAASADLADLNVADIAPTVLVGLYGYDTKDYIIGPHERLVDDNGDGAIDNNDQRTLEYKVGEEHPRFTTVAAGDGKWEVVADLSMWADLIANQTVKRVEIGILPTLTNADDVVLALNAPSRTFDLGTNVFADDFYSPIVNVTDGCNDCHDALATTFHTPDRGGNIVDQAPGLVLGIFGGIGFLPCHRVPHERQCRWTSPADKGIKPRAVPASSSWHSSRSGGCARQKRRIVGRAHAGSASSQ